MPKEIHFYIGTPPAQARPVEEVEVIDLTAEEVQAESDADDESWLEETGDIQLMEQEDVATEDRGVSRDGIMVAGLMVGANDDRLHSQRQHLKEMWQSILKFGDGALTQAQEHQLTIGGTPSQNMAATEGDIARVSLLMRSTMQKWKKLLDRHTDD
jgi:hypothetical protein